MKMELSALPARRDPLAWAVSQLHLARLYEARLDLTGRDDGQRAAAILSLEAAFDVFADEGLRSLTVMASDADNLFTTLSARLLRTDLFIVARVEAVPQRFPVDLGIEISDPKLGHAVLARQIGDHRDIEIDPAVGAGISSGPDNHRHAEPARGEQHRLEVLLLPLPRARRNVRPEWHRPDIARPGIGANQIRLAMAANAEAARLDRREAEMPVRAYNTQRVVGGTCVLYRCGHASRS